MDRRARLVQPLVPGSRGIEIGAWFAPLVPKREGWQTLVLDVFPTEELRQRAVADPNIPEASRDAIEEVDLVGSAVAIAELAEAAGHAPGSFDFVISSHNFEHLPDPIRFLQGVERLLRPGGVLSMAIPDRRSCFDHLRPPSTLGQLLEAKLLGRERPGLAQLFDHATTTAERLLPEGAATPYFPLDGFPEQVRYGGDPAGALALMQRLHAGQSEPYHDAHCWAFSPAEFAALMIELRLLGLLRLEQCGAMFQEGVEFHVVLRKPEANEAPAAMPSRQDCADLLMAERREMHLRWAIGQAPPPPEPPPPEPPPPAWFVLLRPLVPVRLRGPMRRLGRRAGLLG